MSKVIKIRRGLDIRLLGTAERVLTKGNDDALYAITPSDFRGLVPKMLVKEGDSVKAGTPLFFSKEQPEVMFTSPVSGTVNSILRGEKRRILSVTVKPDGKHNSLGFDTAPIEKITREQACETLLKSGLWPCLVQRPYGIVAQSDARPKAIFVSGLDTAPLAPDLNFLVQDQGDNIIAGLEILKKLTDGKVHLCVSTDTTAGVLSRIKQVEVHLIEGPHPAGNVGTQIAQIDPIGKGETVWSVDLQHVVMIGRLFLTGKLDMTKIIALAGSEVTKPHYYKVISGVQIGSITDGNIRTQKPGDSVRIISGNPLTGRKVSVDEFLGFCHNQVTILPEGDHSEMFGWAMPRFKRFSVSHSYFSWLSPRKKYRLDTNLCGGERAFVMTGIYEKVFPLDIYPVYLMKAILASDVDKMENLGIYEVIEEDFALCEFIDPSKIEWQAEVSKGIDLMIKEA